MQRTPPSCSPSLTWTAELLLIRRVDDLYEVGGAALKPADFVEIINSANQE